jgi:pseudouridylate synthase
VTRHLNPRLLLDPEVEAALSSGAPVVALESTIISHGMPYPQNAETARAVEADVRAVGAIPATIAVMDGRLCVGIAADRIDDLARTGDDVVKVSRRDLPFVVRSGVMGGTTVAATMLIARMAGIRVFATGGIGGVHRGVADTFDVSADLQELARTDVAVVCAGVKSILDIGKTLEYLETLGVPVIGFGTDRFPAFYTVDSGFDVAHRLDTPQEVADLMHRRTELELEGGIVVANPIPAESAMAGPVIDRAIDDALEEAAVHGVTGKDVTPFVLGRVTQLTGSSSLAANIALVRANAGVAAAIAVALADGSS